MVLDIVEGQKQRSLGFRVKRKGFGVLVFGCLGFWVCLCVCLLCVCVSLSRVCVCFFGKGCECVCVFFLGVFFGEGGEGSREGGGKREEGEGGGVSGGVFFFGRGERVFFSVVADFGQSIFGQPIWPATWANPFLANFSS